MKIAIVLGSSRKNGNTAKLVQHLVQYSPHTTKVFDLLDYNISPYDYQFNNQADDFKPLITEVVEEYDALILASPIYWYSPSSQMKIFMDRITDLLEVHKPLGRKLKGKPAGLIATGVDGQPNNCFETIFSATFNYLNMPYFGMLYGQSEDVLAAEQSLDKAVANFANNIRR